MTITVAIFAVLFVWLYMSRKLTLERRARRAAEADLDDITERLYGGRENYERAKESRRECRTVREEKVAHECAEKGIPRAAKQYPGRFKSTRR